MALASSLAPLRAFYEATQGASWANNSGWLGGGSQLTPEWQRHGRRTGEDAAKVC